MTYTTSTRSSEVTASNTDIAALLLRLLNGAEFLIHGGFKIFVFGFAGTAGFFASLGLPGPLAYVIIALEVIGGAALIMGTYTRVFSALLACDLVGAIVTVHGQNGFLFTNHGGGWEYPACWAITLIALILIGPGAYVLSKRD